MRYLMIHIKKRYLVFACAFVLATVLCVADLALADYRDDLNAQLGAVAGSQGANLGAPTDPRLIAALIIRMMLGLLGTLFLAYTVYAGYLWMTSAGDTEKIDKAKATIRRSVIGLIIILSAYSITQFVTRIIPTNEEPTGNSTTIQEEPFDSIERQQERFLNTDPLR